MCPNLELIVERAKDQGWRVRRTRRGHWQFFAPDGESIVVTGGTPGERHARRNFLAAMRRAGFRLQRVR